MPEQNPGPEAIAGRVADGTPVDWDEALRRATDGRERRILGHLRAVENIFRLQRKENTAISNDASATESTSSLETTRVETAPSSPEAWGHLELREMLGEGSFGEVFKAWDSRLDREVALKLLKAGPSRYDAIASTVIAEARLLARLGHPNVVTVYGAEIHDGRVGLWMEFIRGRSLEQLLQDQGSLGAREAALIGIDLCRALAAVHRIGVVHRDVKAQNAMRAAGGRIVLMDFGTGIEVSQGGEARRDGMTGTPFYMAPEVLRGEPATPRSDIYSLGVLLYRLVTAAFPVEGSSLEELREKHAEGDITLLRDRRSDLAEAFLAVVERALSADPRQRFDTAGQMEQALVASVGGTKAPPTSPRRPAIVATVLLASAVAFVAIGTWLSRPHETSNQAAAQPGSTTALASPSPSTASEIPPATGNPGGAAPNAAVSAAYTVEAGLYRENAGSGTRTRLESGARLSIGDQLTLEFEASARLHVYVIDEDDAGHAFALFPLPGFDQRNPLSPGTKHVLPGGRDGKRVAWKVDTPGGREHLMVLASPTRLIEFEAEMNALARPGMTALAVPESAKSHLRGIGRLAESSIAPEDHHAGHLFELAQQLVAKSEFVNGVWLRRIDLENPHPK